MKGFVPAGAHLAAQKYAGMKGYIGPSDRRRRIPGMFKGVGCAECGGSCGAKKGMSGLGCGCGSRNGMSGFRGLGRDPDAPMSGGSIDPFANAVLTLDGTSDPFANADTTSYSTSVPGSSGGLDPRYMSSFEDMRSPAGGGGSVAMASDVPGGVDPNYTTPATWNAVMRDAYGQWVNEQGLTFEQYSGLGTGSSSSSSSGGWVADHRRSSGEWVDASGRTFEEFGGIATGGTSSGSSSFSPTNLFAVPGQITGAFGMTPAEAALLGLQLSQGGAPRQQPRPQPASSGPSMKTLALVGLGILGLGGIAWAVKGGRRASAPAPAASAPAERRENRGRARRRGARARAARAFVRARSASVEKRRIVVYGR